MMVKRLVEILVQLREQEDKYQPYEAQRYQEHQEGHKHFTEHFPSEGVHAK